MAVYDDHESSQTLDSARPSDFKDSKEFQMSDKSKITQDEEIKVEEDKGDRKTMIIKKLIKTKD